MRWHGRRNSNLLVRHGVFKLDLASMQTDTSVRIAALGTILEVAFYRTTDSSQLATNLMVAPGLKMNFQKRIMVVGLERAIRQDSKFGIFGSGLCNK